MNDRAVRILLSILFFPIGLILAIAGVRTKIIAWSFAGFYLWLLGVIVVVGIIGSVVEEPPGDPVQAARVPALVDLEWYQGGTLHDGKGENWVRAAARNRLATAADFAATALDGTDVGSQMDSMDDLLPYAEALKTCLDETYIEPANLAFTNSDTAALCWILMFPELKGF